MHVRLMPPTLLGGLLVFTLSNAGLVSGSALRACADRQAAGPDPNFRVASGRAVKGFGIDLDHRHSQSSHQEPGTCAHDDLVGMSGEQGIDKQFYRAVGCVHGLYPPSSSQGRA